MSRFNIACFSFGDEKLSRVWFKKEIEILENMWGKFTVEEICTVLKCRSVNGIIYQARKLGLPPIEPEIDLEQYAKLMEVTEG